MHDFKYSIISNSLGESTVCTACHAETDERRVQGAFLLDCNEQRKCFLPLLFPKIHAVELSTILKILKFSLLITVYEPIFIQKHAKHDIKELSFPLAKSSGNRFYLLYLRSYKHYNKHDFKYSIISTSLGDSSVYTACHAETDKRCVQGAILPVCNEQRK